MKKKILILFMTMCMVLTYMPSVAFAVEPPDEAPDVELTVVDENDAPEMELKVEPEETTQEDAAQEKDTTSENKKETVKEEEKVKPEKVKPEKETPEAVPAEEPVEELSEDTEEIPHTFPAVKWKADEEGNSDETAEWQTEDFDAPENPIPVTFKLEGITSVQVGIYDSVTRTVSTWQTVKNGTVLTMENGSQVTVKGVAGKYLKATSGLTLEECKEEDFPDISTVAGGNVGVGLNGDEKKAVVYIAASNDRASLVVPQKPVVESTPVKGLPFKVGDTGTGLATYVDATLRTHHSPLTVKITSGWLKKYTKVRYVTGHCYSGSSYSLSRGGTYKYDIKVLSISDDGKARIRVRIHPYKGQSYYPGTATYVSFQHHSTVIEPSGLDQTMEFSVEKSSEFKHHSHPENYTLAGAKYQVYKNNGEPCKIYDMKAGKETDEKAIITVGEDGKANKVRVKVSADGTDKFYLKEIAKDSAGNFALAKNFYVDYSIEGKKINGEDGELKTLTSVETPVTGYLSLRKLAKKTNTDFLKEAPNNYTLGGAEFAVYTNPQCTTPAKDIEGNVVKFVTERDGSVKTGFRVDVGDYWAKETVAPKGYKSTTAVSKVHVKEDGTNDASHPATFEFTNDPTYEAPEIKIFKYDESGKAGWDELTGAYYQISYYDITCKYGDNKNPDPASIKYTKPTRKWIFKTRKVDNADPTIKQAGFDWNKDEPVKSVTLDAPVTTAGGVQYKAGDKITSDQFYEEPSGTRILPIGFYTIEEIKAPVGITRNDKVVHGKVYQPAMGQAALDYKDNGVIRVDYDEPDQTVTISVQKVDAQTGQNVPEGTSGSSPAMKVKELAMQALSDLVLDTRLASFGSLAGAEYNVYFNNDETNVPEIVGTIVTDENGYGELTKRTAGRQTAKGDPLLPGNYFIEEVKASPGYVIDKYTLNGDDTVQVLDREIEVICGYTDDGKPVTKTIGGNYVNEGVEGNVNFTGDEDNEVAVKGNIGSRHVFHARVQGKNVLNFKYTTKSEDAHHETEFSKKDITTGEELPGATLQVINSDNEIVQSWVSTDKPYIIKALPNGTYTLREITAPYGYDIAEDVTFTVEENVIKNRVEMKNKPITVGTQALDEETKSHQGTFGKEETIKDVVKVTGLYKDRVYTLTGVLVDKATGQPMKNAAGEEIKSEPMTFTATGDEMEVEVFFKVDSSEFTKNTTLVAYEYLARAERFREEPYDFPGEEFPKELAKHENPDDEEQTIHYGGIVETVAMDKASKSHNILADQNVTIVDTVKFENLSPKEEYVISGELYDKTTGQLTGIKATKSFVPEAPNGTVEVEFTFDATELKNHDLVAFENIAINGTVFDKHENPDDEAQTVYVPEIFTTATDLETNDHIAYGTETVNVKDSVVYHNLIPGKEYVMNGTLMNKKTGEPVMDDGEEVTASATFTPTEPDGEVELVFTFNGTELLGETVVAFEECTINNVPVAVHADLEDENQSVDIPKIGTKAKLAPKDKEVKDTVMYENLKPGKYVMKGWLVNKKNGKKLKDSDGETEFEITEEHASGKVLVELPVTGYSKLGGYKLTAFEELYYVGEEEDETGTVVETEYIVADHKDKNDKDQIVEIPGIKTGDSKSIFIYGGILFALAVTAFFVRRKRR